eukprot:scaffold16410_cov447-Ochromonas_danica.AAC.1
MKKIVSWLLINIVKPLEKEVKKMIIMEETVLGNKRDQLDHPVLVVMVMVVTVVVTVLLEKEEENGSGLAS